MDFAHLSNDDIKAITKQLNEAFGRVLKRLRAEASTGQELMAGDSHLSRSYISLLEKGAHSPTLATMYFIASVLDMPVHEIVKRAIDEFDNPGPTPPSRRARKPRAGT